MANFPPRTAAEQRELVRRGYDAISGTYRRDDGSSASAAAIYGAWLDELAVHLPTDAHVLDIGCGAGVPADRWLIDAGFAVTGVDISQVQISRARRLVPDATFILADLATFDAVDEAFDAVISLYALIHLPLDDQRRVFPRIHRWLRPGGVLLAIVGHEQWTGVEDYLGAPMFWDHADAATYLAWLEDDGFDVIWDRFIPEGASGHTLVLARRRDR